jgi:hypothetical protein
VEIADRPVDGPHPVDMIADLDRFENRVHKNTSYPVIFEKWVCRGECAAYKPFFSYDATL